MVVATIEPISALKNEQFQRDGFIVREPLVSSDVVERTREALDRLFAGEYDTGLVRYEVEWRRERSPANVTRQICNAWKGDRTSAATRRAPSIGRACAELMVWQGTRINQNNILWKPPGGKALGFQQDPSYEKWVVPSDMVGCRIARDDITAHGGTV